MQTNSKLQCKTQPTQWQPFLLMMLAMVAAAWMLELTSHLELILSDPKIDMLPALVSSNRPSYLKISRKAGLQVYV